MLTVSRLSITPVRGFRLQHPAAVHVDSHGVADDRRYVILGPDGRIFDGTKLGMLVQLTAELIHDPERLSIAFPDGSVVAGEIELGSPMTITVYSRKFAVRPVLGPWAGVLSAWAGKALELVRVERTDGAFDRHPVSIVSSASVEELGRHVEPQRAVDARRFRMLVEVAGASPHEEDEWLGWQVGIGEALVLVTKRDARCVITTQDPNTGHRDIPTLHVIKSYRGLRDGKHLDFGVYADVLRSGEIRVGDPLIRVRSGG